MKFIVLLPVLIIAFFGGMAVGAVIEVIRIRAAERLLCIPLPEDDRNRTRKAAV